MAERRMFTQKIIDSDAFLDMPLSAQALYFHLSMRADDDGFVNNPKKIQRTVYASEDDLKLLILKRFLLCFESGVIVIKHWRMHNSIRRDRYTPTQYQEEFSRLGIKQNGAYTEYKELPEAPADDLPELDDDSLATTWQPDGNQAAPQDRLGKDRLGKESIGEDSASADEPPAPPSVNADDRYIYVVADDGKSMMPVRYESISSMYNRICKSFPHCTAMSDARKKAIKARFTSGYTMAHFETLFTKAEASSFLKGKNDRNWRANFDWLIKDANMAKVLDGNYDDRKHNKEVQGYVYDDDDLDFIKG